MIQLANIKSGLREPRVLLRLALVAIGLFITGFAAYLRLKGIGSEPFWMDEGYTMAYTEPSFFGMLSYIASRDVHPPLYYAFMKAWQQFGDTETFLRLPSALFGIGAVWCLWLTLREHFGELAAIGGSILLAVSGAALWYSQEVRMYSLVLLLTVLSLRYFLRFVGWMKASPDSAAAPEPKALERAAWGLGLSTAALLYTHNVSVFMWASQLMVGVVLLAMRLRGQGATLKEQGLMGLLRTPWGLWAAVQVAVGIVYLPWFIVFMGQNGNVQSRFWVGRPNGGTIWATYQFILAWRTWLYPASAGLVGASVIAMLVKTIASPRDTKGLSLFLCTFVPIYASYIYSLYRTPMMVDRTLIFTAIPAYMLLASFLALPGRKPSLAEGAAVGVRVLAGIVLMGGLAYYNYKNWDVEGKVQSKEDFRAAASNTLSVLDDQTAIVFPNSASQAAFDYYLHRGELPQGLKELGVPCHYLEVPKGNANLEPLVTEKDLYDLEGRLYGVAQVVLVSSHQHYSDPRGMVQWYFNNKWRMVGDLSARGVEVRVYQRAF